MLRKANYCIDFLANKGLRAGEVVTILDEPPSILRALLVANYMGSYSLRI